MAKLAVELALDDGMIKRLEIEDFDVAMLRSEEAMRVLHTFIDGELARSAGLTNALEEAREAYRRLTGEEP